MTVETALLSPEAPAPHLLRASRRLLEATVPFFREGPRHRALAERVLSSHPEYQPEFDRAAHVLAASPLDLALAVLSYDLTLGMYGCSTAVLATEEGPVVARNMDWAPEDLIAQASCVVPTPGGLNAGFAGSTGVVTGLSRRGFAVVLNAVGGALDPDGFPVLLFLRHLVDQATGFDHALHLAVTTRLMAPALITLAGTRNDQRAVVERTPSRAAVRTPCGDEPLVTTNHYRLLERPGDGCDRYEELSRRVASLPSRPTDDLLLDCLTRPPVLSGITAQHVVARPREGSLRMWVPESLLGDRARPAPQDDWLGRLFA